ncbi:DTHAD-like protein [Mya arenaria]|uniref:DTHAD-like protein n=1 Tax=Mya arenaria TaxID=6604 RepID=A0ABY7FJV8_MYAAR|nr:DTHAD-like protein [Mya arenaria]
MYYKDSLDYTPKYSAVKVCLYADKSGLALGYHQQTLSRKGPMRGLLNGTNLLLLSESVGRNNPDKWLAIASLMWAKDTASVFVRFCIRYNTSSLWTPCALVDIDRVKKNVQRMIDNCTNLGVELRPHMKTHKTMKIVVSTIAEAEFYADGGFDDIIFASPMVKERISKRVISLATRLEAFHVMVDSVVGMQGVIDTPLDGDKKWNVFMEVDCGYGRTGCVWDSDDALMICRKAAAAEHVRLEADGIPVPRFGCGSTPSCSRPINNMGVLTEFHPGNYIFYDYMQVLVGSCSMDDIAMKIVTTVISHKPEVGTLVVDCGWNCISQDGCERPKDTLPLGYTPIVDHPELSRVPQQGCSLSTMYIPVTKSSISGSQTGAASDN